MAAIAEMLLQSHAADIELLPALPKAWPNGSIAGLRARGGFEVDITWHDGKMSGAAIKSIAGTGCTVRYGGKTIRLELKPGQTRRLDGNLE